MTPKLSISPDEISAPPSVSGKSNIGSDDRTDASGFDDISAKRLADALGNAYLGITCSFCGSVRVVRAGSCGTCLDCATSTGC